MEYSHSKIYDPEVSKIVAGVRVAECMALNYADNSEKVVEEDITHKIQDLTVSNVLNCSYCNVSFNDATEQRNHFKLDWHRYNLKRALCDKQPVTEDIFSGLADDVSSISGSDSESSNREDSDMETSESQEKKDVDQVTNPKLSRGRHSKAFFENSENKVFSVYKCLLHSKKETISNSTLISSMTNMIENPKKWLIVMIGGGHFAAAIFNDGVMAQHKTFHCYTVRAKQGGSQSTRDNRGGTHPKSAGASLRRYNELALVQHVQEIMGSWSDDVKQCQLILYRATGRYNRGVIFGGKNPPLEKGDPRLRNIPFPTRRATYKEIQRVHDILSTVEVYGSSADFKDVYPRSPKKPSSSSSSSPHTQRATDPLGTITEVSQPEESSKKKNSGRKIDRSKARSSPEREIPGEGLGGSSDKSDAEDDAGDDVLISNYTSIDFGDLQEYVDTVPEYMKESQNSAGMDRKEMSSSPRRRRKKSVKSPLQRQIEVIHKKLVTSCENEDESLLLETLRMRESLPESVDEKTKLEKGIVMTKEDFTNCLNSSLSNDTRNTILHVSALKGLADFITPLLEAGADPTVRNRNRLTPYVVSANKETRNSFKNFVSLYPDMIDCKKANIPEPLSDEMKKVNEDKKRDRNRMKRQKDKMKKKETKEKREEEKERQRFLALSDREKCALAAERRMLASATANLKNAKPPVLSRCFLCGVDITGKIPFEYGTNRFCSVPCVKAHRQKTNSYGVEI